MNIELDEYEAINLLWLLVTIQSCNIDHYLNTGDWANQIRFKLHYEFEKTPLIYGPNVALSKNPRLYLDYEKRITDLEKKILG